MLSRLDRAQEFLVVAEQRYREVCNAKEIGDAKTLRRKIKEAKRVRKSAQQQRDFAAVVQVGILSYLGSVKVRHKRASTFDIYYGGVGKADGVGHGHIVVRDGRVVYRRDPSLAHLPEGEEV